MTETQIAPVIRTPARADAPRRAARPRHHRDAGVPAGLGDRRTLRADQSGGGEQSRRASRRRSWRSCNRAKSSRDLKVSLIEFAVGFGLSLVVGIGLGIAMGLNRFTEYAIDPFVWFLYSSPLIAFYPLIIVWLGFGFATVVTITFLLSFVSVVVNTVAGVQGVDPQLIRAVRAFGGARLDVIRKVILPAAVPLIIAGMRIGLGRALHGVVLGEMFSSNAGLGYRITFYAAHLRTADVFVPLVILVVIGLLINQLGNAVEARLQAWRA